MKTTSPLVAALDRLQAARDDVQLEVAKLATENQRLRRIEQVILALAENAGPSGVVPAVKLLRGIESA